MQEAQVRMAQEDVCSQESRLKSGRGAYHTQRCVRARLFLPPLSTRWTESQCPSQCSVMASSLAFLKIAQPPTRSVIGAGRSAELGDERGPLQQGHKGGLTLDLSPKGRAERERELPGPPSSPLEQSSQPQNRHQIEPGGYVGLLRGPAEAIKFASEFGLPIPRRSHRRPSWRSGPQKPTNEREPMNGHGKGELPERSRHTSLTRQ